MVGRVHSRMASEERLERAGALGRLGIEHVEAHAETPVVDRRQHGVLVEHVPAAGVDQDRTRA